MSAEVRLGFALVLLLAGLPGPSAAHELDLARYRMTMSGAALSLQVDLAAPASAPAVAETREIGWPDGCSETDRRAEARRGALRIVAHARCEASPAPNATVQASWGADGATLDTPAGPLVLARRGGVVILPLPSAELRGSAEASLEYLRLGVVHILEGFDHLSFVLCLFMLAAGRALVALITAFTVGHSLSLALAHYGLVTLPVAPTEAVIALSIVFMAAEALVESGAQRRRSVDLRSAGVVSGFGLLHGLGFANVLAEIGVDGTARALGLLSFNLGVELGQLLFVGALAALFAVARFTGAVDWLRTLALYGAGGAGAVWFGSRVAGFAG